MTSIEKDQGFNREDWASAYCNVEKEVSEFSLVPVKGFIPKELNGTFYKNGPGRLERNGHWVHHPFDGDGMISALCFQAGKVTFTNRFVRTKGWVEEERKGKFLYRGVFGTKKLGGIIQNAFDLRLKNIANTHVIKLGDQLLALWEAAGPHALNPNSLETYGLSTLNGVLDPGEAFSAHPRFDPGHHKRKRMVTFGVNTGPKSTLRLMEFETEGRNKGELISSRKDTFDGFAFLHDFAITPNWAIFLQNAISFNPIPFIFGQKGAAQCLSSKVGSNGSFLLIPRDCGKFAGESPKVINSPAGFVFHHLNAYEKNDNEIILESIFYRDFPSIGPNDDFRKINFELLPEGILSRCEINIRDSNVKTNSLSNQCCEFAMVNPSFQGLSARYSWMAVTSRKTGNAPLQAIKKLDLSNESELIWSAGPRGFVSEPLMIPNKNSKIEDNGWIIVLVWNGKRASTDLVILKADTLEEQATIELPIPIPHGLHGSWAEN